MLESECLLLLGFFAITRLFFLVELFCLEDAALAKMLH